MISPRALRAAVALAARQIAPDDPTPCAERLRLAAVPTVLQWCPGVTDRARLAALLMWCDRHGAGRLQRSGLRQSVRARNWTAAASEVRRLGGRPERCEIEAQMLLEGDVAGAAWHAGLG